jgi:hypothetical protein
MSRRVILPILISSLTAAVITTVVMAMLLPGRVDAQSASLRAKSLTIVDDNGMIRAALGTSSDGSGALLLMDANGRPRLHAFVRLDDGEPELILSFATGVSRADVSLASDGSARIAFADVDGTPRFVQSDGSTTIPGLAFYDQNSLLAWSAP